MQCAVAAAAYFNATSSSSHEYYAPRIARNTLTFKTRKIIEFLDLDVSIRAKSRSKR